MWTTRRLDDSYTIVFYKELSFPEQCSRNLPTHGLQLLLPPHPQPNPFALTTLAYTQANSCSIIKDFKIESVVFSLQGKKIHTR